jgi:hypothetical protein
VRATASEEAAVLTGANSDANSPDRERKDQMILIEAYQRVCACGGGEHREQTKCVRFPFHTLRFAG